MRYCSRAYYHEHEIPFGKLCFDNYFSFWKALVTSLLWDDLHSADMRVMLFFRKPLSSQTVQELSIQYIIQA